MGLMEPINGFSNAEFRAAYRAGEENPLPASIARKDLIR